MGLPLAEISLAKLLSQLFSVTEKFEMQTQPQLLLLQKTMLVAEGVGRQINDQVNIWELARPLIEEWMIEYRSPPARLQKIGTNLITLAERMPKILDNPELIINQASHGGLQLHPDTVQQFIKLNRGKRSILRWPTILFSIAIGILIGMLT